MDAAGSAQGCVEMLQAGKELATAAGGSEAVLALCLETLPVLLLGCHHYQLLSDIRLLPVVRSMFRVIESLSQMVPTKRALCSWWH